MHNLRSPLRSTVPPFVMILALLMMILQSHTKFWEVWAWLFLGSLLLTLAGIES